MRTGPRDFTDRKIGHDLAHAFPAQGIAGLDRRLAGHLGRRRPPQIFGRVAAFGLSAFLAQTGQLTRIAQWSSSLPSAVVRVESWDAL